MKFIFETMTQSLTVYSSPVTGINYDITLNNPFNVENKEDIKFFEKNKRFKKAGAFTKPKADKTDYEDLFRGELLRVEGLGEDTVEAVIEIYMTRKQFVDLLEQNLPLDKCISLEERDLLKKAFLPKELQKDFNENESESKTVEEKPKKDKDKDSKKSKSNNKGDD